MYLDKENRKWFKVGLHIHTSVSDGRLSPEDAKKRYREAGFDAIALTDHWKFGEGGVEDGLTVLSGAEYNVGGGDTSGLVMHIVGVNMKYDPKMPEDADPQTVIDKIEEAGGIAILAHPAWSLNTPEMILPLHGFSALEIYNSVSDVGMSFRPYSGYITDILANKGYILPLIATDDTHYYEGEDDCVSYIMVEAESSSADDIISSIKEQRFYATQGPKLYARREGDKIVVDCSEAKRVCFVSGVAWSHRVFKNTTHAEYTPQDYEKWVRVEVETFDGKFAWSNIFDFR